MSAPAIAAVAVLAWTSAFFNGRKTALVAPVISTRAISRSSALLLTAEAQFVGPFLFGTAVAPKVSVGLIASPSLPNQAVVPALMASVSWISVTDWIGIPSSSLNALMRYLVRLRRW